MRHICAWCKEETAPPDGNHDELETHGICKKCCLNVMAGINALDTNAEATNQETTKSELRI